MPVKENDNEIPETVPDEAAAGGTKEFMPAWLAIILFTAIAIAVITALVYVFIFYPQTPRSAGGRSDNGQATDTMAVAEGLAPRLLDGVYVPAESANLVPLAVMIDNQVDARPPAGLDRASLVFEAEVEGGITRYMAVFSGDSDVDKIGPVRSARPYFLDWAHELSALYAHVGGSPEALVKIKQDNIFDINEFYNGSYFWRADDRIAPHNVFTSTANLTKYLSDKGRTEGTYFGWSYKDDAPKENRPVSAEITIDNRSQAYSVSWRYDTENNDYIRYLAGEPHMTMSGDIITAKNVVIQIIPAEEIDAELRLSMDVTGEGRAAVCRDGSCEEGTWQKKSASSRTRYYDTEGNEISFDRGLTWVEAVRPERKVTY